MNCLLEDFKNQAAALVNPESLSAVTDDSNAGDDTESNEQEEKTAEEYEKESSEETPKADQKIVNDDDILIFVQNYLEKLYVFSHQTIIILIVVFSHSQELLVLAKLSAGAVELVRIFICKFSLYKGNNKTIYISKDK